MTAKLQTDPRVDAYIAKSADFARPILTWLRTQVHAACPEVVEDIKWGMPFFMVRGQMLGSMAAFKAHCAFGFWHGSAAAGDKAGEAMGQYGRITRQADLPGVRAFRAQARATMQLFDAGVPRAPKGPPRAPIPMPADFAAALAREPAAQAHYTAFAPSKQYDYLEWIVEAKRADTREKRIAQAVEWIGEGKARHWKYQR